MARPLRRGGGPRRELPAGARGGQRGGRPGALGGASLAWAQPPTDEALPLAVGPARELGLVGGSFSLLCWVRNDAGHSDERRPIFMGDLDPPKMGRCWSEFKREILHCELRHDGRYYFGFGWDDSSSVRANRAGGKWDHVAFVYDADAKQQAIVVNGERTELRCSGNGESYQGDETIRLGDGRNHGIGTWEGAIKHAAVFREALTDRQIAQVAAANEFETELAGR